MNYTVNYQSINCILLCADKQHGVIKQKREKIDALDKTATDHGKRLTNVEESAGRLLNDLGESNLQIGGNEKNLRGHSNELAEMGKTFDQIQGRLDGHRQHFTAVIYLHLRKKRQMPFIE